MTPMNDRYGNNSGDFGGRNTELSHITAPPKDVDRS